MEQAAITITILLVYLALFQLLLVLGLPLARAAWGGRYDVLPASLRIESAIAIAIYALAVWTVRTRTANPDAGWAKIAPWFFAIYFLSGVLLNLASSSPWERWLMAPLAFVLSFLSYVVAGRKTRGDSVYSAGTG